jgi:hypothetical protein
VTAEPAATSPDEPLTCVICGRPLGNSIDDQPDWATGPMCGDCYQAQQMDDELIWDAMEQEADDW